MHVRTIEIRRENDYGYGAFDASKPFRAIIKVNGQHGQVELNLSAELSQRVVAIIADEVAAAGRATAEAMTAEIITQAALAAPEGAF